ncbi:MAG: GGDEF domain-containing protein, partial [Cyanobium sp.]|nr:GGDEF domain-containing protein [Cyanobium sp.]
SGQVVLSALVVDQRGVVLAASNNALVGLPLSHVLQLPAQGLLRQLFDECPSASSVISCLSRDEIVYHGYLPGVGGEAVLAMHPYPLALEALGGHGDRATLITITDARSTARETLRFTLTVFLGGLLPLMAGCAGLMLRLRQRLIPELLRLAQVDALSGMFNRRAFLETGEEMLRHAEEAQLPMTLALIDVDHFKQINDTYGHDAGDQVICRVSDLLRSSVRRGDLVGRLGGDEFVILVQLPADQASAMLTRTLAAVRSTDMEIDSSTSVLVTLSIGMASSSGPGGHRLNDLLSGADAALYVAKDRGRAQVVHLELEAARRRTAATSPDPDQWQVRGV